MSVNHKRLRALPILGAAVAAAALMAPAANAAMGGANAITTSLRPDLRSATVVSTNIPADQSTVDVCFDAAISSLPQAANFSVGTYDSDSSNIGGISAVRQGTNCARVTFQDSDVNQYTHVTVNGSDGSGPDAAPAGVSALSNGFGNIMDSTAIIGANSNNGTAGFSSGPDLIGIAVTNAVLPGNTGPFIDYTFDQEIGGINGASNNVDWFAYRSDGTVDFSSAGMGAANAPQLSADRKTMRVFFAGTTSAQMSQVVRGAVNENVVLSKAANEDNQQRHAVRPGTGGFTDRPDLVNAVLASNGHSIDLTFDQALVPGSVTIGDLGGIRIGTSDGDDEITNGSSPAVLTAISLLGTNTVEVECPNCAVYTFEHEINASVEAGLFDGTNPPSGTNTAGGLPLGGNVGAKSTGFTNAPEALAVSFNTSTDVAQVRWDSRFDGANNPDFVLLDDAGAKIGVAPINVSGAGAPNPVQTISDVTFPSGTLAGARSLLIEDCGVFNTPNNSTGCSAQQAVSPTAPAAKGKFRPAKHISAKQRKAARRAVKRH